MTNTGACILEERKVDVSSDSQWKSGWQYRDLNGIVGMEGNVILWWGRR
jgi:hypothetical protein